MYLNIDESVTFDVGLNLKDSLKPFELTIFVLFGAFYFPNWLFGMYNAYVEAVLSNKQGTKNVRNVIIYTLQIEDNGHRLINWHGKKICMIRKVHVNMTSSYGSHTIISIWASHNSDSYTSSLLF